MFKVPRVVLELAEYNAIERRIPREPVRIIYNRLEVTSQIIPGKIFLHSLNET